MRKQNYTLNIRALLAQVGCISQVQDGASTALPTLRELGAGKGTGIVGLRVTVNTRIIPVQVPHYLVKLKMAQGRRKGTQIKRGRARVNLFGKLFPPKLRREWQIIFKASPSQTLLAY